MNDTGQRPDHQALFELASDQAGYFTTAQAGTAGFSRRMLAHYARRGRFQHRGPGLYRLRDFPFSPHEEIVAAWLAVGKDRGVVSHETALDLLDLSDVIPDRIHVTVPRSERGYTAPPEVALHTSLHPPRRDEIVWRHGVPLTDAMRTLLDVAEAGTDPEQVTIGVRNAVARGMAVPESLREEAQARGGRAARLILGALEDNPR